MNKTLSLLPNELTPAESPARLAALVMPDGMIHPRVIQALAAHAARGEHVGIIIGHNRFALYDLTRAARQRGFAPQAFLAQFELSRAFTCHQLHYRVLSLDEARICHWRALFVLGLLDTFYDESVPYHEAARLLSQVLEHLYTLTQKGLDILVTAAPPKQPGRETLLELIERRADHYARFSPTVSPPASSHTTHQISLSL